MEPLTSEQRACREALTRALVTVASDGEDDADLLIREFGSLPELLAADTARLRELVQPPIAEAILALSALVERSRVARAHATCTLATFDQVVDYLHGQLAWQSTEQLQVLFFAPGQRLIRVETVAHGTVDRCPVYPREIIKRALQLGASALVLAHNHPSGDPQPSKEDIAVTRDLIEGGRRLGVAVHDHIVIGREGHCSLRALGMI